MTDRLDRLRQSLADRYRIERELGAGGMATVYLAYDLRHDRKVALKVLRPELAAAIGAERFLVEIKTTANLQHPHILPLHDSGTVRVESRETRVESPGTEVGSQSDAVRHSRLSTLVYYVMPYVDGESLRQRLTREGRLSPGETVRILQQVADALAYAHRQGIVHRDIKPENIMISDRHALVVDFGVAKAIAAGNQGTALTTIGLVVGTPAYMAPEQAAGHTSLDGRADLYAVGVVGYELLTGQPPFSGTTPQAILAGHISREPPPLGPDVPASLAATIMRCLAKDPADRWQSGEALRDQLETFATPANGTAKAHENRGVGRRLAGILAAIGLAVIVSGIWYWTGPLKQGRNRTWAHEQAIPQILNLAESGDWGEAYRLAEKVHQLVPHDSLFDAMRPRFAREYEIRTAPAGAEVWRKGYSDPDSGWELLGRTPIDSVLVPLSGPGGTFLDDNRIRIQAPGYRTLELIGLPFGDTTIMMDRDSAIPPEMVRVAGGALGVQYPGFADLPPIQLQDYLMDRFEVTNGEFKKFVDAGGYRRREWWPDPILKGGQAITFTRAIALMTDRTGRTGPSTWTAGEYPGRENYPVGGVSWYEAMAYAKFAGKSLPSVVHWNRAASVRNSAWIVPASNYSGQGPTAVGSSPDISAFGTYDMAGNVREWCLNASDTSRFILGGGWADPPYRFNDTYAQSPLDRSPVNGIRLVKYAESDSNVLRAAAQLSRTVRDFLHVQPVNDAVFAVYRQMYEYDHTPLNPRVLETVDEGDWTRELVRVDAAYTGDSLLIYLYLPKHDTRPVPAVVYFPPGSAIHSSALSSAEARNYDFMLKSGRAVLYPVYKSTYQRQDSLHTDTQDSTIFWRDHVIMWVKDLRRAIDYLETRPEVTTAHLAYYGISWGAEMGGLIPAVEPRLTTSILLVAGLDFTPIRPEADPVNYLPRVKIPTLMINGRYDFYFPIESSQRPMFRLLGTPPDQKRHVIEEGSHFVPRVRQIKESLDWLDKYQPVAP